MDDLSHRRRLGALTITLALSLAFAGCSSGAPSAPPSDTPAAPPSATPQPSDPPPASDDGPGPVNPGVKVVVPRPGQLDVHPVAAETLTASVDGRRLTLTIDWWSGVEPCTILDTVLVQTEAAGYAITLREGRGPEDVACIAIAEQHRTVVEFPDDLAPGTYTIRDGAGGAPSIEVTIS